MIGAKAIKILCFCVLLCLAVAGQNPAARPSVSNPAPKTGSNKNKTSNPKPGYRMGDWLRAHQNLSPEQQEKLLENDPNFKHLPPQRQAELKERLRKFNSLPPAQRARALNRLEWMSNLTPQQRQDLRDANQTLQKLPQDRQVMIHKALRHLRQMNPQERQQEYESDRFKSTFSDEEQGILTKLASLGPEEAGNSSQAPAETPK